MNVLYASRTDNSDKYIMIGELCELTDLTEEKYADDINMLNGEQFEFSFPIITMDRRTWFKILGITNNYLKMHKQPMFRKSYSERRKRNER